MGIEIMETSSGANPVATLLGFGMLIQLVVLICLLLGGIYVLYCLGRAAAGMDRLASAVEALVQDKIEKETALPRAPVGPSPVGPFGAPPVAHPAPPPPAASPFQTAPANPYPVPDNPPGAPPSTSPPPVPPANFAGEPRPTNPAELGPPAAATVHPPGAGDTQNRL